MPSPSTSKSILSLPFAKGLSQKEDARWLAPGALLTAQNAVHPKTNVVQKRQAFAQLPPAGVPRNPATGNSPIDVGKRLANDGRNLLVVGKDIWTDALWNFDDQGQAFHLLDRIPEVYVLPDQPVAGFDDVIREMDTCVCNGYAIHVFAVTNDPSPTPVTKAIYYTVQNAATGETLVPPRLVDTSAEANAPGVVQCAGAKIVACGTVAILGFMVCDSSGGNAEIRLYGIDCTKPWAAQPSGPTIVTQVASAFAEFSGTGVGFRQQMAAVGAWDLSADPSSSTTFHFIYQSVAGDPTPLLPPIFLSTGAALLPPVVLTTTDLVPGESPDPPHAISYTVSGGPYITAFGLDINAAGTLAGCAYAFPLVDTGHTFPPESQLGVHVQQFNLSTLSTAASYADLMVQTGPLPPGYAYASNPQGYWPNTIQIASNTETASLTYRVAWSPAYQEFAAAHPDGSGGGTEAAAVSFIAIWSLIVSAGPALQIQGGSPRVTFGVCCASRWLPNENNIGYMLARIPSWEQGTFYLLADDAWQDFSSQNLAPQAVGFSVDIINGIVTPSTLSPGSFFPMRLVGTLAPRLSSMQIANLETTTTVFSQATLPAHDFVLQDQYQPHALPHLALNPGATGGRVFQALIGVSSTVQSQNPTLVQMDFRSALAYQSDNLGTSAGFACGAPTLSDGSIAHEFAFPYYPSIIATGFVTSDGLIFLVNGTFFPQGNQYSYIAIYDWVDARGQLHRSARSLAVNVLVPDFGLSPFGTALRGVGILVQVTMMGISGKEKSLAASNADSSPQSLGQFTQPVTVRLFRTQNNGTIYYEVASHPNVQGAPSFQFVDAITSDAEIGSNTLLYGDGLNAEQQGAILDNLTPPAFQCLIVHNNRFVGIDGKNVWATKELVDGEGPGFNELSAFSWDDGPGPITAAASMDGKLILFKRDRVGYVTGQGPQDDGGQNDWSPPNSIATDVGCLDWRSVVVKPDGIYFRSSAGERMLTRDLQVVPVPDVEDVLAVNAQQTSAVVHPTEGRILITANTDDTTEPRVGVIVDRDYVLDSWMTAVPPVGAVSAVVADVPSAEGPVPTYHFIGTDGDVWRESPSSNLDTSAGPTVATYVPMQVETAWVKAEGIEGFARFRRLIVTWENLDPHQLSVYVAYDYQPTYYLMGTVTAAMMLAMSSNPFCQQLFSLARRRAEAVRFKLVDAADATTPPVTGAGPLLVSLGLEVSAYTNRRVGRLPPAQRS